MHSLALFCAALAAPAFVLAAQSTSCFTAYPALRTGTGNNRHNALQFTVFSSNRLYDGHSVQLRPQANNVSIAVIDSTSPVLAYGMNNGIIYSTQRDVYDGNHLGPIGGLQNVSSTSASSLQAFVFRNATGADSVFASSSKNWQLVGGTEAAYNLYQNKVPAGVVQGFVLCNKGKYAQFFFSEYTQNPPNLPGCDFVAIQTIVSPTLS